MFCIFSSSYISYPPDVDSLLFLLPPWPSVQSQPPDHSLSVQRESHSHLFGPFGPSGPSACARLSAVSCCTCTGNEGSRLKVSPVATPCKLSVVVVESVIARVTRFVSLHRYLYIYSIYSNFVVVSGFRPAVSVEIAIFPEEDLFVQCRLFHSHLHCSQVSQLSHNLGCILHLYFYQTKNLLLLLAARLPGCGSEKTVDC